MSQSCPAVCQLVFALFTLGVFLVGTTDGCFFRNCPLGGKRSVDMTEGGVQHQCMSCGPEGKGQCVGPSICCHKDGCIMGSMAKECSEENESTTVCVVKGLACGTDGQGRCVADGVCCDESACSANSHCDSVNSSTRSHRQELIALLKRFLTKVK